MTTKKRKIFDYFIYETCYHSIHNLRRCKMHANSLNPFHRSEYRIVDCKMVYTKTGKYIAFYALLAYGQMKIIKGNIYDDTKELYKKVRKALNENEPVCIKFDSLASVPFVAPAYGLGTSIFADGYALADITKHNLSPEEMNYYTAPFTKKEWIYK